MQQNDPTTDGQLVALALDGRASALEELARRWAPRVIAFCHARIGPHDAAEDLAQESLLRGFRSLGELRQPQYFGTWLRGIALRVCLDWLKDRRRSEVSFGSLGDGHGDGLLQTDADATQRPVDAADAAEDLLRQVDRLPVDYREVLLLYYYDTLTYQDLAEMLGVSTATVNARLTKARAMLRKRMTCPHES